MPGALAYDSAAEARHRALRTEFLLDPKVVFLNHGAFGACPRPVFEVYQSWQRELERQPVDFLHRRLRSLLAAARAPLAAALNIGRDDLVYLSNVTEALSIVARSLPLEPGDEILTTDHEYGAMARTWAYVAERRGAHVVCQPLPTPVEDPEAVVEAIWAGVTTRTRVLFVSHVTSPTAIALPIAPLVARARAANIWTVVDGAHAVGQLDLDLTALGVDFYLGNCHKWLSAPRGAGFLYVRPDLQRLVEPLVISWGWRPLDPDVSPFVDLLQRQGTRDPAAHLTVPTALEFQAARDWPRVRQECRALVQLARDGLADLTGLAPLVADTHDWFVQMAVLPLPPETPADLPARLSVESGIEIPLTYWGHAPCLRISVQGYNTRADVEQLLDAVAHVLPPTFRRR